MATQSRVVELVEIALESHLSPEELCAGEPELLADVQACLDECRNLDLLIDEIFPSSATVENYAGHSPSDEVLPAIPGFEVIDVLGRGGIGVIFRVRHLKLNRMSALKMLLSGEYASRSELARFMREARAVAALRHPNIVQLYDVGELAGRPYFTMELVEGGSLAKMLCGTPKSGDRAAALVSALARATHVAHQAGIVHRDLKPANVLLTSDGTPKISDFGLASQFSDEASLTVTGARLGTPSYMAPEQVVGKAGSTAPAVDIYALGAILFEMLTGRPPFHGPTALETQRKVVSEDCAPPSRLNPKIVRDLETICLKCLSKTPHDRYESAASLADDLDRFLRFEPIKARPISALGRSTKWVRRRKAIASAIAAGVLLVLVVAASVVRSELQEAHLRHAVENDLSEVQMLESTARWENAQTVLRRAEARLDVRSNRDLRQRITNVGRDLSLARRLDAIRLSRATAGDLDCYQGRADEDYKRVFQESAGLSVGMPIDRAAMYVKASPIYEALVMAIEDWAISAVSSERREWILGLAAASDRDESGLWAQACHLETWDNPDSLAALAANSVAKRPSMSALLAVGERLRSLGKTIDAGSLLRRVQREHPGEFWPNLLLGEALNYCQAPEAENYFRAALAIRPDAAVGYNCVGDSLENQHKYADAIEYYDKSLEIDPHYARAEGNLAEAMKSAGRYDEAIEVSKRTLRLDPNYAWAHFAMAGALRNLGRFDEALSHYAIIYAAVPGASNVRQEYFGTMVQVGRGEEGRVLWNRALDRTPSDFAAWVGYPDLCLFLGNVREYHRVRGLMFAQFGARNDVRTAQLLTLMSLLAPAAKDEQKQLRQADIFTDRAVAAERDVSVLQHEHYQYLKGLTEYRSGRSANVANLMSGLQVLGPCPKLVAAMALKEEGRDAQALTMLAEAVVGVDWRMAKAYSRDEWMYRILRREAESKIVSNCLSLLDGSRQPINNHERLVLLADCQFNGQNSRCAQLFRDALAAEPKLIENRSLSRGFVLACATCALAARDTNRNGNTGNSVTNSDRALLLSNACQWLESEQSAILQVKYTLGPEARERIVGELAAWAREPGLACMRESKHLQLLSAQERNRCLEFWKTLSDTIDQLQSVRSSE